MEIINKNIATVFDIQGFSVYDGPGCRTVIFLKGCPLKCKWCANPEGIKPFIEIMYNEDKCIHDKLCITACSSKALSIKENIICIDTDKCSKCANRQCIDSCCSEALRSAGYQITTEELMSQINRDRQYWGDDGGVTFTGGEPFFQHTFLKEILSKCSESYIHTAVETCGCVPWKNYENTLQFIDWIFFDVKHMLPENHKSGTGCDNKLILNNLMRIVNNFDGKLILRIPIIPGYNDTEGNISEFIKLACKIKQIKGEIIVNILPMHHLAKEKYKMLRLPYVMNKTKTPSKETMKAFKEKIAGNDITCYIGSDTPF